MVPTLPYMQAGSCCSEQRKAKVYARASGMVWNGVEWCVHTMCCSVYTCVHTYLSQEPCILHASNSVYRARNTHWHKHDTDGWSN